MRMVRGKVTNLIHLIYTANGQEILSQFCPTNPTGNGSRLNAVMTKLLIYMVPQVALLTIYDMCKAVDRGMTMTDVHLAEKHGGKSGSYVATQKSL
jgi:hypothetical protein